MNQHRYQIKGSNKMETIGSIMVHDCTSQTPIELEPLIGDKAALRIGPVTFVFATAHSLSTFMDRLTDHGTALAADIQQGTFK